MEVPLVCSEFASFQSVLIAAKHYTEMRESCTVIAGLKQPNPASISTAALASSFDESMWGGYVRSNPNPSAKYHSGIKDRYVD